MRLRLSQLRRLKPSQVTPQQIEDVEDLVERMADRSKVEWGSCDTAAVVAAVLQVMLKEVESE